MALEKIAAAYMAVSLSVQTFFLWLSGRTLERRILRMVLYLLFNYGKAHRHAILTLRSLMPQDSFEGLAQLYIAACWLTRVPSMIYRMFQYGRSGFF